MDHAQHGHGPEYEDSEETTHEHSEHNHDKLIKDARVAAWINLGTGVLKSVIGIWAVSPVLVTDGAHDFGDFDTYLSDVKAIEEKDPQRKAKCKIRAGFKLGAYAVAGTFAETIAEQTIKHAPLPFMSLAGGIGSLAINYFVHKRFSHHHHEEAEEVKDHGRLDLLTSAITIGASVASFAWLPALFIGSIAHIGIYSYQATKTYRKFKDQAYDENELPA